MERRRVLCRAATTVTQTSKASASSRSWPKTEPTAGPTAPKPTKEKPEEAPAPCGVRAAATTQQERRSLPFLLLQGEKATTLPY